MSDNECPRCGYQPLPDVSPGIRPCIRCGAPLMFVGAAPRWLTLSEVLALPAADVVALLLEGLQNTTRRYEHV